MRLVIILGLENFLPLMYGEHIIKNNLRRGEMSALSCFQAKRGPFGFSVASLGKAHSIAPPAAFSKV